MDIELGRKKRRGEVKRLPIELDLSDPTQAAVWRYWDELASRGQAASWVREVLAAALPSDQKPTSNGMRPAVRSYPKVKEMVVDEPHYEPIEE